MSEVLVGWPGGSLEATIRLVVLLIGTYALVLWLSAVVWVYRDAKMRTADQVSQIVAVLLVGLFNLPGLLIYLVIRPQETMAEAYERSLEAEAILREIEFDLSTCQGCQRPIEADFHVCPYCRAQLRESCKGCGRAVRTNWTVCAYCGVERPQRREAALPRAAAAEPLRPPQRQASAASQSPAPAPQRPETAPAAEAPVTSARPTRPRPPIAGT